MVFVFIKLCVDKMNPEMKTEYMAVMDCQSCNKKQVWIILEKMVCENCLFIGKQARPKTIDDIIYPSSVI